MCVPIILILKVPFYTANLDHPRLNATGKFWVSRDSLGDAPGMMKCGGGGGGDCCFMMAKSKQNIPDSSANVGMHDLIPSKLIGQSRTMLE